MLPAAAAAASLMLAGCGARTGNEAGALGNGSAEGKAEDGRLTVHAPGMELKIDVPERLRREAGMDGGGDIIPAGASVSGIHVEGGDGEAGGGARGGVEIAFTSPQEPELVARWYRDPARAPHFTITGSASEGPAIVLAGAAGDDRDPFRVRLTPKAGGGTDGRVTISEQ
jgi:hypothetical protein